MILPSFPTKKLLMFALRKSCGSLSLTCCISEGTGNRMLSQKLPRGEAEERFARTALGLKQEAQKGLLCLWELQG